MPNMWEGFLGREGVGRAPRRLSPEIHQEGGKIVSSFSDRAQDDIGDNLAWWLANGDAAWSVEQQAYDVAEQALDSGLIYTSDVIEAWREAGMPDSDDPQGQGIVAQMASAVIETFIQEDFAGVLDEAVSQFIDQHPSDNDAVLDCLAQYGWRDAWAMLLADDEGEEG